MPRKRLETQAVMIQDWAVSCPPECVWISRNSDVKINMCIPVVRALIILLCRQLNMLFHVISLGPFFFGCCMLRPYVNLWCGFWLAHSLIDCWSCWADRTGGVSRMICSETLIAIFHAISLWSPETQIVMIHTIFFGDAACYFRFSFVVLWFAQKRVLQSSMHSLWKARDIGRHDYIAIFCTIARILLYYWALNNATAMHCKLS